MSLIHVRRLRGVHVTYPITSYQTADDYADIPQGGINQGPSFKAFLSLQKTDAVPYIQPLTTTSLTAITASSSSFTRVEVPSTAGLVSAWIIDPGTPDQEVVSPILIDATHFDAIFLRNHAIGAQIKQVCSWWTRYIAITFDDVTNPGGIADIRFIRDSTPIPDVYDQVILRPGYVVDNAKVPWFSGGDEAPTTPITNIPQYDPSDLDANLEPNGGLVLDAGPIITGYTSGPPLFGAPALQPQVQLLFTTNPEPTVGAQYYSVFYREV